MMGLVWRGGFREILQARSWWLGGVGASVSLLPKMNMSMCDRAASLFSCGMSPFPGPSVLKPAFQTAPGCSESTVGRGYRVDSCL